MDAIINNICNQLIAFQAQILTREENKGCPTAEEVNLQCKLINCVDKLRKMAIKEKSEQAVTSFIKFVAKEDERLAETLATQFQAFTEKTVSRYKTPLKPTTAQPTNHSGLPASGHNDHTRSSPHRQLAA